MVANTDLATTKKYLARFGNQLSGFSTDFENILSIGRYSIFHNHSAQILHSRDFVEKVGTFALMPKFLRSAKKVQNWLN